MLTYSLSHGWGGTHRSSTYLSRVNTFSGIFLGMCCLLCLFRAVLDNILEFMSSFYLLSIFVFVIIFLIMCMICECKHVYVPQHICGNQDKF